MRYNALTLEIGSDAEMVYGRFIAGLPDEEPDQGGYRLTLDQLLLVERV